PHRWSRLTIQIAGMVANHSTTLKRKIDTTKSLGPNSPEAASTGLSSGDPMTAIAGTIRRKAPSTVAHRAAALSFGLGERSHHSGTRFKRPGDSRRRSRPVEQLALPPTPGSR